MINRSMRLTIFEGPIGAGKTTLAQAYAKETGALYVPFDPMPMILSGTSLGRQYVDRMMPAVLGYQDVVLDQCWLSEAAYARALKSKLGPERIDKTQSRILDRLALRCGAVMVVCMPPFEVVEECFLANEDAPQFLNLELLYDHYRQRMATHLPCVSYDYTGKQGNRQIQPFYVEEFRNPRHPVDQPTAGNLEAPVLLVVEGLAPRRDADPYYRWPCGSLSYTNKYGEITEILEHHGIREDELLWATADMDLELLPVADKRVVAVGSVAGARLSQLGTNHTQCEQNLLGATLLDMLK